MRVANLLRPVALTVLGLVTLIGLPAAAFAQTIQSAAIVPLDSIGSMSNDMQALTYGIAASFLGLGLRRVLRRR